MNVEKRILGWALALAATGFVIGCKPETEGSGEEAAEGSAVVRRLPTAEGNVAPDEGPIIIGMVASQNGPLLPWGLDSQRGAELAVKEFNDSGVLDRPVELLVEDSNSLPEQGASAASKLIGEGALAIVGEVSSGITKQIASRGFEAGVPVVAVGATNVDITKEMGNVFRVCYTDAFQGPVMATFAYEERGMRRMAIMTDKKQPYSTGLSDSFRAAFEALGGEIVTEEFYESEQSLFNSQLSNIQQENPDGMFLSGYFTEVGTIVRQAKTQGMDGVEFFGGDGWDSLLITDTGGEAIIGGFFCNHYNSLETDRAEVGDFLDKWEARYGGLPGTTMGALGYDATMLVLDALTRVDGDFSSAALIEAIDGTVDFPGVSGSITLAGQNGDPTKRALVVRVVPQSESPTGQAPVRAYEFDEIVN